MERRRFAAKWLIKQNMTGSPRCRRAADAPSVVDFAKVSAWKPIPPNKKPFGATPNGFVSYQ